MKTRKTWFCVVLGIFGFLLMISFTEARAAEEPILEDEESVEDTKESAVFTQLLKSGNAEIQSILNLLNEGEENVKLASQNDVVMVLGNTGSGKSTITLFLAGYDDQLISKKVGVGEYLIEDVNSRISIKSTITSKTIFPELIVDAHSQISYYDCPGFSDTRSAAYDIAAIYFIKKVLDNSSAVKLVFTVSYPSVRPGIDRQDFMLLVRHAVDLVKKVEKYKNSISLIVTKVDNQYIVDEGKFQLIPDKTIIEQIAKFIDTSRQELAEKVKLATVTNEEREFYKKAIVFIETLLLKEGDEYVRLAIFGRVNDTGPLSKLQLLQDVKVTMKKVVDVNTDYVATELGDFGYTISERSKNYVQDLTREIIKEITSDAANIGKEIQRHYNDQEKQTRDMYMLYDIFKLGRDTFSSIKTSEFLEPQVFIQEIVKALKKLNINISKNNFLKILNYDKYLNFLQTVSEEAGTSRMPWPPGLTGLINYLNLSEKWYNFLINFYTILSEYDVQRDRTRFDTLHLKTKIRLGENERIKVSQTGLEKLVNEVNEKRYQTGYNDISSLELDQRKAEMLKDILDLTLDYDASPRCVTSDKVVVKGQYVKLSDILKIRCEHEIKFVEIYALNKIFIDADFDKTGSSIQLSIIAPMWYIVNNPRIILDGKPGEAHKHSKAPNGGAPGSNGQDGKPGHNGGSAGNFFGIGEDFINAQTLLLSVNGGKGGDGQDGGNGAIGRDGENPPRSGSPTEWESNGFKAVFGSREIMGYYVSTTVTYCTLDGKPGGSGGNGGNGGIAGLGGPVGNVTIVGLSKDVDVSISNRKEDGNGGNGGSGAIGGRNGETIKGPVTNLFWSGHYVFDVVRTFPSKTYGATGTAGRPNANDSGKDNPKSSTALLNPALSINAYKNFLRENLYDSVRQSSLMTFLHQIENNYNVLNVYDTLGFVDELNGLENQYHKLHTKLPFLPLYKSLLNRTTLYADNPKFYEKSTEYKSILSHLYTATLSKICSINNDLENNLVIDITTYLDLVICSIKKLKEQSNKVAINEYYKGYKNAIAQRTTEAQHFIDSEVSSAIDNVFNNLEKNIERLIEKTIKMENETKAGIAKAEKEEMELQNSLVLRKLLGGVKVASQFLNFLGPVGSAVGAAVGGGIMVTESLLLDDRSSQGTDNIASLPAGIRNSLSQLSDEIKNKRTLLKEQLNDVNKELEKLNKDEQSDNIKIIKQTVVDKKAELENEISKGAEFYPEYVDKLHNITKELGDAIETQKNLLEKKNAEEDAKVEKQLRVVRHIQNIISIGEMSVDLYSRIRNNQAKIQKAANMVAAAKKQLEALELFELSIYITIMPACRNVEDTVRGVEKSLNGKTHVALDIENWKIQRTLKDMKLQIQETTKGFDLHEDFKRCFDVLHEGVSVMITIYDRIQDYYDKAELAAYIGNVNSANALSLKISDDNLRRAVDDLNLIIKSNLVLGQYDKAVTALTQYLFPFAYTYLEEYTLPANLHITNDVNTLIFKAAEQIEGIKNKLIENKALITQYDRYIHKDAYFDEENGPIFFTWKYDDNKQAISRLLEGTEVSLRAYITDEIDENAVKFNTIGITFKSPNETIENELNKDLQNFKLSMTHIGNSYYRCGNKFYVIPSPNQTIQYKLKKKSNGDAMDPNETYMKIKENDSMLSPFTLWNVKLKNSTAPFDILQKYKNRPIDLNLVGHGSYISKEIPDVCSNDLDRYYKLDTKSEINEIPLNDVRNLNRNS